MQPFLRWLGSPCKWKFRLGDKQSAACCARNSLPTNSWIPAAEKRVETMRSPPSLCESFCGASRHREGVECLTTTMTQAPICLLFHFKTAKPHHLRLTCSWDTEKWNTLSRILHPLDHPVFFAKLIFNQLLLLMEGEKKPHDNKQNKSSKGGTVDQRYFGKSHGFVLEDTAPQK